jgi:DNA-binding FadR family transcriptional regulator
MRSAKVIAYAVALLSPIIAHAQDTPDKIKKLNALLEQQAAVIQYFAQEEAKLSQMSATNGQRYIVLSQKIKNMEASANKYGEKAMAIGGRLINLSLNQESKINLKELADLLDDGIGVLDAAVTFEQADGEFHQEIALAKQAAQEQQARLIPLTQVCLYVVS